MDTTERDSEVSEESKSEVSMYMGDSKSYPSNKEQESRPTPEEWRSHRRKDHTPDHEARIVVSGARNHEKGSQVRKINIHETPTLEDIEDTKSYDRGHDFNRRTSRLES